MSTGIYTHEPVKTTRYHNRRIQTSGIPLRSGQTLPDFTLLSADMSEVKLHKLDANRLIISVCPAVYEDVSARQIDELEKRVARDPDTTVISVSMDLPFTLKHFRQEKQLRSVVLASAFRSNFGLDYGLMMVDGPFRGLMARTVIVADGMDKVLFSEIVPELDQEPDYDRIFATEPEPPYLCGGIEPEDLPF